jgi:hypothetical protein
LAKKRENNLLFKKYIPMFLFMVALILGLGLLEFLFKNNGRSQRLSWNLGAPKTPASYWPTPIRPRWIYNSKYPDTYHNGDVFDSAMLTSLIVTFHPGISDEQKNSKLKPFGKFEMLDEPAHDRYILTLRGNGIETVIQKLKNDPQIKTVV